MATYHAVLPLALIVVLGACSNREAAKGDTANTDSSPAQMAPQPQGEVNSTIHLVVSGGPHAGTYQAEVTEAGCSYGFAGVGSWGNQYSIDPTDPKAFSSLQLIVPDAAAAAGGTKAFKITVRFGPLFGSGTSYDIDSRPDASQPGGSGTVTVDDQGNTGKVTFAGETADGVKLDGTIDCRTVMRAG